jgi:hypothetical protein
MWISTTFFLLALSMCAIYFLFLRRSKKHEESWQWLHQSMATFLSVILGLSVFTLQQNWNRHVHKKAIESALIEELNMLVSYVNNFEGVAMCDPKPEQKEMKIYPVSLQHSVIKAAIDSTEFEQNITRHLLLLYSSIQHYNQWANVGFDMLVKSDADLFDRKLQIHNGILKQESTNIVLKAQLIVDCLRTGTSSLDPDCN